MARFGAFVGAQKLDGGLGGLLYGVVVREIDALFAAFGRPAQKPVEADQRLVQRLRGLRPSTCCGGERKGEEDGRSCDMGDALVASLRSSMPRDSPRRALLGSSTEERRNGVLSKEWRAFL